MKKIFLLLLLSSLSYAGVEVNKQSSDISNFSFSASVAANALTISAKTKAGVDASAGNPASIAFRNSSSTSTQYNSRQITGALSIVVPSTATLGQNSGVSEPTYIYAQDNSGTVQLCVTTSGVFDEGSTQTSTTISVSANSRGTLYCTSGVTGPVRLVGRLFSNQTVAGTWASSPTEISVSPFRKDAITAASTGGVQFVFLTYYSGSRGTDCTSSPCNVTTSVAGVTVTRVSAGVYTINYPVGTFSAAPVCTGVGVTSTGTGVIDPQANNSMDTATASTWNTANASSPSSNVDSAGGILCVGTK